jgi:hypothetical protein
MNEYTFESWSALESKSLDDRRLERERVAAIEAHIEVREWHDAAERAAFLREYGA